jgi:hypothetical protein
MTGCREIEKPAITPAKVIAGLCFSDGGHGAFYAIGLVPSYLTSVAGVSIYSTTLILIKRLFFHERHVPEF